MNTIDEIKAAAAKLDPDQQYQLFRWWIETDAFKQRQFAALKREIAIGIDDLEKGNYQTYADADGKPLAEEICSSGRQYLEQSRKKTES